MAITADTMRVLVQALGANGTLLYSFSSDPAVPIPPR